jgi:hypothetical protein
MIKQIQCGEEAIKLKTTCGFLLHYANQFNSDAIEDIFTAFGGVGKYVINMTVMMRVLWAMAREAGCDELPDTFFKKLEKISVLEAIELIFDAVTVDIPEHSKETNDSKMSTYTLLSCAVRSGLTVTDFRNMTLNALLKFFSAMSESYDTDNSGTRMATQDDFDRF